MTSQIKRYSRNLTMVFIMPLLFTAWGDTLEILNPPPQNQGLPYTRSAHGIAMKRMSDMIAVCAGSRYAYVHGDKVRLDETDILGGEARLENGRVMVPATFASVLDLQEIHPSPAPSYLEDKWVYTLKLPKSETGWVDLAKVAQEKGLKIFQDPRGLLLIGSQAISFSPKENVLLESIITQFDTPEKYAVPEISTRYIPTLRRQGAWTDHVKVTPEQLALLNGTETSWPTIPESAFDYTGLNQKLLGSKVPPPGIYPRVLFSPEDVPMLADRVKSSKAGQMALMEMAYLFKKTWWDEKTSDGEVFQKLVSGNTADLVWDAPPGTPPGAYPQLFKGQKPGIYNSHVAYIPECLTAMALYCLLTGDDVHGRQTATAIARYYKIREPLIDEINSISDSEFGSSYIKPDGSVVNYNGLGSTTHWRTHGGLGGGIGAHMNLGLALDFGGKWMTEDEKKSMQRFIAKVTYGRRSYGQDGPMRWRDINWVTWDLSDYLAVTAIEGTEGFDPEVSEAAQRTMHAFCDWGIDNSGVIYESNGKTPGGLQFLTLGMVTMARRGDNLWGHPHWRKFMQGQVQSVSPTGRVNVNSGTQYQPYSRQFLSFSFVDEMKAFFPNDLCEDYLLNRAELYGGSDDPIMREWMLDTFDPATYPRLVEKLPYLRLPSVTYPGMVHGVLYDSDFKPVTRSELRLPLDFSDPVHGVFSSYSDDSREATWIHMLVRPDHYLGAGHHHADAGMIHFSALGVDWLTQSPFDQAYDGKYFSLVQVDGRSEAENLPGIINGYNARAEYTGAVTNPRASAATADLTYAYSYRWLTQPPQVWDDKMKNLGWELEPNPDVLKFFVGTGRYKMRPWWPTSNLSNYFPTCRAPFNPMQYVYRTTGLVRGPHAYAFVVDDLKKDDASHLFQWVGILNEGVKLAEIKPGSEHELALTGLVVNARGDHPTESPVLYVDVLGLEKPTDAAHPLMQVENLEVPLNGHVETYKRLVINHQATDAAFRVLLLPVEAGEDAPVVRYDPSAQVALIDWKNQQDRITFTVDQNHRTHTKVERAGSLLLESK